ncbi:protein NETWORKED 4A [Sesbania bispinosa]|nr:protein NETWORKED 4A [Sesbania bispinosa]
MDTQNSVGVQSDETMQQTIATLVSSVNNMSDIMQGMAIHLQEQDMKYAELLEGMKAVQNGLQLQLNELKRIKNTSPQTERERVYGSSTSKFTVKPGYNEYRRTTTIVVGKEETRLGMMGRKLCFTPSVPNLMPRKRQSSDPTTITKGPKERNILPNVSYLT